jgi:hypothetical protein
MYKKTGVFLQTWGANVTILSIWVLPLINQQEY